MTAPRTRAQAREQMQASILRIGREELAEKGAAALSLREVARRLGVVSSAVYRYVANRDELLTLLLVDAYDSLADAVDRELDAAESPAHQVASIGRTMRSWALAHPEQWGLIYGAPVPGYQAPEASTGGPGTRVMTRFLALVSQGQVSAPALSSSAAETLTGAAQSLGITTPPAVVAEAIRGWASLLGLVNLEVFGQLGPGLGELGGELMDRLTDSLAEQFSLAD